MHFNAQTPINLLGDEHISKDKHIKDMYQVGWMSYAVEIGQHSDDKQIVLNFSCINMNM